MSEEKRDHAHLVEAWPDGTAVIERIRDGASELTGIRRHLPGRPFVPGREYVRFEPDGDCYRCQTIYGPDGQGARGPAKVATENYRTGWDAIWSRGSQAAN